MGLRRPYAPTATSQSLALASPGAVVVDIGPVNVRTEGIGTGHPWSLLGRSVKRAMDVVLSFVGLVLALPVLLAVALAVRLDSPGPVIFKQTRVGLNGRRFRMLKIRTMGHGTDDGEHRSYVAALIAGQADRHGGVFKLVDDPRITRVGRWLRRFSIDELPQLWNVLVGDMSLVGPRPPIVSEVELYDGRAWERLRVKPGMTGMWQVNGRCAVPFDEMVKLDVEYWRRWNPLLDLAILVKTPRAVVSGDGAA